MIRIWALALVGVLAPLPTLLTSSPMRSAAPAEMEPGPAFDLEVTVAAGGDETSPCGTENHVVVAPDEDVLFCATITNTGTEALTSHVREDSTVPGTTGTNEVVEPGHSMMMTYVLSTPVSQFHEVTWVAAGVDSGTEVGRVDYAYITIDGTQSQLDMTVMVDDGQETCGTEAEIVVPAGTQVRVCYTMTNPFAFALVHHVLIDDHLGAFLIGFGPDLGPGESFVRTDVVVIDETTTWDAYWRAQADLDENEVKVMYQDVDSVTVGVLEPELPTTTTTTTTTTVPCVTTTIATTIAAVATTAAVVTEPPTTTRPPTTTTPTTMPITTTESPPTTTSTTSTSTPTTTTPSFTTTTSTTPPALVLPTTTSGGPAGFTRAGHAGEHRGLVRQVPAAVSCPETPPGGGGQQPVGGPPPGGSLPATGSEVWLLALPAALIAVAGIVLLRTSRGTSGAAPPTPCRRP